jgi:hypothetical protein
VDVRKSKDFLMLKSRPDMPTHLIWAIEHHRQLVEDAQKHRVGLLARKGGQERPPHWQWLRFYAGELLINMGQRLKPDAPNSVTNSAPNAVAKNATNTVWG